MLTVDEMIKCAIAYAHLVLVGKPHAELTPTWLVQNKNETSLIGTPWRNQNEKEIMVETMRLMFKTRKVESYSFISEAWSATESLDAPTGLTPSQREDKREVVIVSAFDRQGGKIQCYEIKRGPDAMVTELALDPHGPEDNLSGRLYNLLAQ